MTAWASLFISDRCLVELVLTLEILTVCRAKEEDMIGKIGLPELLVLLAIVFFLFGAKRLPEVGKGIGEGIKNFKKAMRKEEKDLQETNPKED